jgi:hypothetical protein
MPYTRRMSSCSRFEVGIAQAEADEQERRLDHLTPRVQPGPAVPQFGGIAAVTAFDPRRSAPDPRIHQPGLSSRRHRQHRPTRELDRRTVRRTRLTSRPPALTPDPPARSAERATCSTQGRSQSQRQPSQSTRTTRIRRNRICGFTGCFEFHCLATYFTHRELVAAAHL